MCVTGEGGVGVCVGWLGHGMQLWDGRGRLAAVSESLSDACEMQLLNEMVWLGVMYGQSADRLIEGEQVLRMRWTQLS